MWFEIKLLALIVSISCIYCCVLDIHTWIKSVTNKKVWEFSYNKVVTHKPSIFIADKKKEIMLLKFVELGQTIVGQKKDSTCSEPMRPTLSSKDSQSKRISRNEKPKGPSQ